MPNKDPQHVINHFVDEVINRRNLAAMDAFVPVDFIERVPFPGQEPGREGLKGVLTMFHQAFPDLHWHVDEQIAQGEKVVTRFTWTGTHQGAFLGIPPTGKRVNVWGVVIDVVRDGWFVESRILMDVPALMGQLGAAAG